MQEFLVARFRAALETQLIKRHEGASADSAPHAAALHHQPQLEAVGALQRQAALAGPCQRQLHRRVVCLQRRTCPRLRYTEVYGVGLSAGFEQAALAGPCRRQLQSRMVRRLRHMLQVHDMQGIVFLETPAE